MNWRDWLKGRNQPSGRRHGGSPNDNTGSGKHGRSNNAAKNVKKKKDGGGENKSR